MPAMDRIVKCIYLSFNLNNKAILWFPLALLNFIKSAPTHTHKHI